MSKKKDWKIIEESDISRNYRRLQRYLDLLINRTEICLVHLTKETTQKNVYRYLNKNYYLVLSSEDFALIDAYHCQYQGRRVAKKRYPELVGTMCGLSFIVSDTFGYTNLWEKKFVDETLKELKKEQNNAKEETDSN